MTIWKYELVPHGVTTHMMPQYAHALTAQHQDGKLVVWAMVDEDSDVLIRRYFYTALTGEPLPKTKPLHPHDTRPACSIGTVQLKNGLVVHILETGKPCE